MVRWPPGTGLPRILLILALKGPHPRNSFIVACQPTGQPELCHHSAGDYGCFMGDARSFLGSHQKKQGQHHNALFLKAPWN